MLDKLIEEYEKRCSALKLMPLGIDARTSEIVLVMKIASGIG
jgi:hypothetical protein